MVTCQFPLQRFQTQRESQAAEDKNANAAEEKGPEGVSGHASGGGDGADCADAPGVKHEDGSTAGAVTSVNEEQKQEIGLSASESGGGEMEGGQRTSKGPHLNGSPRAADSAERALIMALYSQMKEEGEGGLSHAAAAGVLQQAILGSGEGGAGAGAEVVVKQEDGFMAMVQPALQKIMQNSDQVHALSRAVKKLDIFLVTKQGKCLRVVPEQNQSCSPPSNLGGAGGVGAAGTVAGAAVRPGSWHT